MKTFWDIILYMCMQPESCLGMVEVNEKAPGLWDCKEGDGERPLLHQNNNNIKILIESLNKSILQ